MKDEKEKDESHPGGTRQKAVEEKEILEEDLWYFGIDVQKNDEGSKRKMFHLPQEPPGIKKKTTSVS